MTTHAFLLDIGRCIGCQGCVAACKTGNEIPEGRQYIHIVEQTRGVFPNLQGSFQNLRCYHCADAACVTVCPTGALYKEDGLTRLNRDKCSGCTYCVDACPFDVPVIADDGRSSKCDACAAVVKAGGMPWCVKTCPSQALRYDDRDVILAEAHQRADALRVRYPNAQVYGETQSGGLGVVMVLPDDPAALGFPGNPDVPVALKTWQKVMQPASLGLTGLSIAVTGVAAIIARRIHMQELRQLHTSNDQQPTSHEPLAPAAQPKKEEA